MFFYRLLVLRYNGAAGDGDEERLSVANVKHGHLKIVFLFLKFLL